MSNLKYFNYAGFGERVKTDTHYSQAVKIGDRIEISGQGGWDRITEKCPTEIGAEVNQAFENAQVALQEAGGKGWEQVYKVRAYGVGDWQHEQVVPMIENLKKWCPNHEPLLTVVGVKDLAFPDMHIEIEVEAYLGD